MAGHWRTGTQAGRRLTAGLAIALVAPLAAAGCGDGDARGDGDRGAVSAFCEDYTDYQQQFSRGASYGDVVEALHDLDPPPAVADDFRALVGAAEAMATVDTSDPAAVAEFQATTSAAAQEANSNILEYVAVECQGLDLSSEVVPPTSGG